ncbi:MAG: YggT family protein [Actinobacteria bacterium]|nr:YggT family protein [Actinomycetota bacterium]
MIAIVCAALSIYILILLARAIFSWIPVDPQSVWQSINSFCFRATEPVLAPVRSIIPVVQLGGMGLDLSFMVVFFAIIIVWQAIC